MSRAAWLLSSLSATAVAATPAQAQAQVEVGPAQPEARSDEAIIVTGTRRTDRTLADSPVPVDVIGNEALTDTGYTETNRILNQLVPSFNFPQPSLTDGTDSLRPATLRGLAPDQVLVLVNGKRRHSSSLINLNGSVGRGSVSVDLNTIPPLAIERIEVLRDGASSLYGSDAIAGVINIRLRRAAGGRAQVTYGRYITSLEDVPQVTGVVTGPDGLPVVLTAGGTTNDVLQLATNGRDRHVEDGETWTLATNIGLPVGDNAYLNFTAEVKDRNATNRTAADPRRQYVTVGDPRELTIDRYTHRYGDGESNDMNFFYNAGMDLGGGGFELYSFGSYGIRDGNGAGFYRRANDARNRDWAASTTTFIPIYPNGFLPLIVSEIEDVSAALGVRGETAGWNLDLSAIYGRNRLDYSVENSVNTSLGGLVSNRRFDAGGLRFGQTVVNFDAQRTLAVGFLDELSLAVGAEYRNENFRIVRGEEQSYVNGPFSAAPFNAAGGSQVFPGFRPNNEVDESRNSVAAYIELDADVSERLTFQIAGRFEHYSDFGNTVNGKIAGRFEPVDGVAVRGSVSTGFRAPSLHQQFFTATSTNNVGGVLIEVGTFPVSDPVSIALGAQALDPEKSLNLGAGLTLTPVQGLSVTADVYQIEINDRIVLTENLQGAAVVALLQAAGINNITSARFFVNGIDTRTRGLDIVGSYRLPDMGIGRLSLTAGYNYNKTRITDRAALPSLPGLTLFARPESLRLTHGQPRSKINLGIDWSMGMFGFTGRTNRYGRVLIPGTDTNIAIPIGGSATDITLSPKWITDAELRIRPLGREGALEVAVGANNLFDVYPDRLPAGGIFGLNNFFLPYSSFSPFGFNGRFVYGRVSVEF
ncbi:MAG TPA: TonB-dependent receptor [Allosphingosinicella sp.]|nr:TonB-dependent receptor [Allosphingosinicella sp.]